MLTMLERKSACLRAVLLLLAASLPPAVAQEGVPKSAADPGEREPLRVLFVGNSYTYFHEMPWMVRAMAAADPGARRFEPTSLVVGGATLERHLESGKVAAALAAAAKAEKPFEIVVLQEQSLRPLIDPAAMHRAARELAKQIRAHGARPAFFLTWARQGKPDMLQGLEKAYTEIAEELDALLVPVGRVFARARELEPPLETHDRDGSHPSPLGSWLAAATFHATLQSRPPGALSEHLPARIEAARAPGSEEPPRALVALEKEVRERALRCWIRALVEKDADKDGQSVIGEKREQA